VAWIALVSIVGLGGCVLWALADRVRARPTRWSRVLLGCIALAAIALVAVVVVVAIINVKGSG
jgi:putative copper export protein